MGKENKIYKDRLTYRNQKVNNYPLHAHIPLHPGVGADQGREDDDAAEDEDRGQVHDAVVQRALVVEVVEKRRVLEAVEAVFNRRDDIEEVHENKEAADAHRHLPRVRREGRDHERERVHREAKEPGAHEEDEVAIKLDRNVVERGERANRENRQDGKNQDREESEEPAREEEL